MRSQPAFRLLTAGVLIAGASLAVTGLLAGSAPASVAAAPAMLANFTWSGADSGDGWLEMCNWHPAPSCSYNSPIPDGTDDHPTIPLVSGVWGDIFLDTPVNDPDLSVGDMTILDGVDFKGDNQNPKTLTVETLTINADDGAITVTFRQELEFIAH